MVQADDVASHDPQRVAKQILAMYGKHTAKRSSKRKKSFKKNKDLHEVKVSSSSLAPNLQEESNSGAYDTTYYVTEKRIALVEWHDENPKDGSISITSRKRF